MIEAVLLQVLPPVREALQVRVAYHGDHLVYAEHVLLHHLIVPLLDLIQSPYHGIIVMFVAECLPHVHQQVPHRDIFTLIQCVGPFAQVPMETGEDVGVHTSLIILLKEGIYIEVPERVHHLHPWISRLKDRHIQSSGHQPFPLPTASAASVPMLVACSLTHSGVSIRVWCPPVWGRGGQTPSTDCSALGLWGPSAQLCCPHMGGEPCLSHLAHPRGSSGLLRCTSHQLARGVRPRAAPTGILWTEFSGRLLSLWQSEAATDHHHASIRGTRLMLKWAEHEIHSEKASSTWVRTASTASCPKPQWPCLS